MAVAIEIRYTSQSPADWKSWAERATDVDIVVQIPDRCLTRCGITNHLVRVAIDVKVSYYGRACAKTVANSKDLVRIRRIY